MEAVTGLTAGTGLLPGPGAAGPEPGQTVWRLRSFLELTALASAVPRARAHARLVVAEWGLAALADPVEQVVSELVTNGVRATAGLAGGRPRGLPSAWQAADGRLAKSGWSAEGGGFAPGLPPVRLWMHTDQRRVLIEVWDGGEGGPEARSPGADSESGRGLWLVAALSEATGTFAPPGTGGKVVWAMIAET